MNDEMFSALLDDAKNYLDVTWEDPGTDEKLSGILRRGMNYLDEIAGAPLDFSQEGQPRALLFDYARYARANALDDFQGNYKHELLALHMKSRVKEAEAGDQAETAG